MARAIQAGEPVRITFEFTLDGEPFAPPGPLEAFVRYHADDTSLGPFALTQLSSNVFTMIYAQTDDIGLYFVSVSDADRGYADDHFQVWRRTT